MVTKLLLLGIFLFLLFLSFIFRDDVDDDDIAMSVETDV